MSTWVWGATVPLGSRFSGTNSYTAMIDSCSQRRNADPFLPVT